MKQNEEPSWDAEDLLCGWAVYHLLGLYFSIFFHLFTLEAWCYVEEHLTWNSWLFSSKKVMLIYTAMGLLSFRVLCRNFFFKKQKSYLTYVYTASCRKICLKKILMLITSTTCLPTELANLARPVAYLLCTAPRTGASPCTQEHWAVCSTAFPWSCSYHLHLSFREHTWLSQCDFPKQFSAVSTLASCRRLALPVCLLVAFVVLGVMT